MDAIYEAIRDNDIKPHVSICHSGCKPHFHSSFEILYVIDGEFNVIINDKSVLLHAGDVAVSIATFTHIPGEKPEGNTTFYLFLPCIRLSLWNGLTRENWRTLLF